MALEVFAKLDKLGESCAEDHIFVGRKQDLSTIAKWLNEEFEKNKRKKKILSLSEQFKDCSLKDEPYIRLNKKDSVSLHQALKSLLETKRSAPLKALVNKLDESLWLY